MKKFELKLTIVDNKNSIAIVIKNGKVIRNLTLKNSEIEGLLVHLNKLNNHG